MYIELSSCYGWLESHSGEEHLDAISLFDPRHKVRWFVVDRKHGCGIVAEFESPAVSTFHTVNAWQQNNSYGVRDIVCDLVEYPNLDIFHRFYYSNLMSSGTNAVSFIREKGKPPSSPFPDISSGMSVIQRSTRIHHLRCKLNSTP